MASPLAVCFVELLLGFRGSLEGRAPFGLDIGLATTRSGTSAVPCRRRLVFRTRSRTGGAQVVPAKEAGVFVSDGGGVVVVSLEDPGGELGGSPRVRRDGSMVS